MNIPIIIFNDNTDYDAVLESTKLYFSIIKSTSQCGCDIEKFLCDTLGYIFAADYYKSKPDNTRYEEAVEAAYLSLNCNC